MNKNSVVRLVYAASDVVAKHNQGLICGKCDSMAVSELAKAAEAVGKELCEAEQALPTDMEGNTITFTVKSYFTNRTQYMVYAESAACKSRYFRAEFYTEATAVAMLSFLNSASVVDLNNSTMWNK